jgi:ABC-2 type transport system ATP-binding protein
MIQVTGLTKVYRRGRPPALLDLSFDARPGTVTVLLGEEGAGKSTALRLMVELDRGRGATLFDGRTYRRLRHPERQVGVMLPMGRSAVGHPGRRAADHLRMLAASIGAPLERADELLEQTRLAGVAGHRLRTFSPGMHRRLALAAALLGRPAVLLLDAPTEGLPARGGEWFQAFLRSFAVAGGNVVVTMRFPQEAALLGDRVVTLDAGRSVADQSTEDFRRSRLSPEVAVRGPQMVRLGDVLRSHGAVVRADGGTALAVSGIGRTEIGELAYRHGILLHELADRVVEQPAPRPVLPAGSGRSGQVRLTKATDPPPEQRPLPVHQEDVEVDADAEARCPGAEGLPPAPPAPRSGPDGAPAAPRGPRHRGALPTVPSLLSAPRPPEPSSPPPPAAARSAAAPRPAKDPRLDGPHLTGPHVTDPQRSDGLPTDALLADALVPDALLPDTRPTEASPPVAGRPHSHRSQ